MCEVKNNSRGVMYAEQFLIAARHRQNTMTFPPDAVFLTQQELMMLVVPQTQALCVTLASKSKDILRTGTAVGAAVLGRETCAHANGSLGFVPTLMAFSNWDVLRPYSAQKITRMLVRLLPSAKAFIFCHSASACFALLKSRWPLSTTRRSIGSGSLSKQF